MHCPIKVPDYFKLLRWAVDKNILCFDYKAVALSKRLIRVMEKVCRQENIDAQFLILGEGAYFDLAEYDAKKEFCGYPIRFIEGFDINDSHTKYIDYFDHLDATNVHHSEYPSCRKLNKLLKEIKKIGDTKIDYEEYNQFKNLYSKLSSLEYSNKESICLLGNEKEAVLGGY